MLVAAGLSGVSCVKQTTVRLSYSCYNSAARLREAWHELEEDRLRGCEPMPNGMNRCEYRRRQIEEVAQDCPTDVEALMVNAVLAYDDKQFAKSQQLLDSLFSLQATHPDAAVLRARLALDQGNTPFALKYLEQQIQLSPDHAGLSELYASALYSVGRFDQALDSLTMAERLGAPAWRIAYARGLIAEATGRTAEARAYYEAALRARGGWQPAQSRLRGLDASSGQSPR
jgi:tetratricopeptide (TPR) repeat protein